MALSWSLRCKTCALTWESKLLVAAVELWRSFHVQIQCVVVPAVLGAVLEQEVLGLHSILACQSDIAMLRECMVCVCCLLTCWMLVLTDCNVVLHAATCLILNACIWVCIQDGSQLI